jgi:hypothetical protein
MRDREVINRFCAFSLLGWKRYNSGDMDSFLAEALGRMNQMSPAELTELRIRFDISMEHNYALFGRHAFRKSLTGTPDADRSVLNIALLDVCSVLLAPFTSDRVAEHQHAIRRIIKNLVCEDEFVHSITYSTNSRKQVQQRFREMETRLIEVMQ